MRKELEVFEFNGFLYHYEPDNSERCVEIPIIARELQNYRYKKILEVGDVLFNHDVWVKRDILDKYERRDSRIINQDVLTFNGHNKYDFIFSISTIEHVGDGKTGDPYELMKAYASILNLMEYSLKPDGHIMITWPYGHNTELDSSITVLTQKANFSYLKKISQNEDYGNWQQCSYDEIIKVGEGKPFSGQNGVVVLQI